MYAVYDALNGTVKQVDMLADGWVFIGGHGSTYSIREAIGWRHDWVAARRHCGGLLILRKMRSGNDLSCEELTLSAARRWIAIAGPRIPVDGFLELFS